MARRILIVDDAPMMRCMMKDLLEEAGYEIVAEIGTGEEAVQRYPELKPDLVTMDLAMPDMDGIAAIQAIVKIDPKATVIVCSSMGWSSSMTAAIKAGAKEFFIKPVPPDRFLATVKALLDKKISQA